MTLRTRNDTIIETLEITHEGFDREQIEDGGEAGGDVA